MHQVARTQIAKTCEAILPKEGRTDRRTETASYEGTSPHPKVEIPAFGFVTYFS